MLCCVAWFLCVFLFALCALISLRSQDAQVKWAAAGCGLLRCDRLWLWPLQGTSGGLSYVESRGERCLTGTVCAESKLFRGTWTYIWCDYVWRSQLCSILMLQIVIPIPTSQTYCLAPPPWWYWVMLIVFVWCFYPKKSLIFAAQSVATWHLHNSKATHLSRNVLWLLKSYY